MSWTHSRQPGSPARSRGNMDGFSRVMVLSNIFPSLDHAV